jgi:HD-GYP domain-containing protein (c-di-GMP phosphodiesterase class II)
VVHNVTPLELPEILSTGVRVECRKSLSLKDIYPFSLLVISPDSLERGQDYEFLFQHVGVMLWDPDASEGEAQPPWVDIRLSRSPGEEEIDLACRHMVRLLELKENALKLHNAAAVSETRNRQLNQIGVALMSERNLDNLLNLILEKAMALTGSDAGCLYLVEPKEGGREDPADYWADKQIRFKLTRNRSVAIGFAETVMPPSRSSIVGNAMLLGKALNIPDVYAIGTESEFRHNGGFDQTSGYRTRSMLTLPLKNHHNQVIGAIQLINKCRTRVRPIISIQAADEQVVTYRQEDVNVSLSLASQASVALLNAQYERDIKRLFEGFINASVTAIESRDPTTSGHSNRVAGYCVNLAGAVTRQDVGKYRDAAFDETSLRELRYAALLHDFGKIGVRERVLVKAKKLFPEELERIRMRADFIKRTIQWQSAEERERLRREAMALHAGHGPGPCGCADVEAAVNTLKEREAGELADVDEFFATLSRANEPMRLAEDTEARLHAYGEKHFPDLAGNPEPYLRQEEIVRLSIPKGTLSREERLEIESHVTHTYKFLAQIPWTADLKRVPLIAYAHHEKLDGTGYPRSLSPLEIPLSSQIMTICDIYDALTAADRPYKKAIPTEKALDILGMEVKEGKIDPELYQIFLAAKIFLAP